VVGDNGGDGAVGVSLLAATSTGPVTVNAANSSIRLLISES
jgi:hypothetical protein